MLHDVSRQIRDNLRTLRLDMGLLSSLRTMCVQHITQILIPLARRESWLIIRIRRSGWIRESSSNRSQNSPALW